MNVLDGKCVVVTGGAGLLGKVFCNCCAREGAKVFILDINESLGQTVSQKIISETGNAAVVFQKCDITSSGDVREAVGICEDRFGPIDALVNNAYPRNPRYGRKFEEVTYEDFCENVSMHLGGYFNITREIALRMIPRKKGNIINMASIYGFMAPRFEIYMNTAMTMPVEYAAIKGGILTLTRYFASYLGKYNIRVNAISPGGIEDNQPGTFIGNYSKDVVLGNRMARPDDISGVLLFLLSDYSKYITGQNIVADGGWSI